MSKQIERLIKEHPEIFNDVSYEGNGERGDGTWLYLQPSWRYEGAGHIHEYTIKEVLDCAKDVYQSKEDWIEENPNDLRTIAEIRAGKYDKKEIKK